MKPLSLQYHPGQSFLHRLDGRTKIVLLGTWTASIFLFIDMRVLAVFLLVGIGLISLSGIPFSQIRTMVFTLFGFVLLTAVLTNVLTPGYAGRYFPVQHVLLSVGPVRVTRETLVYSLMLMIKYAAIFPMAILFVLTTHPGRLASSLHRLGLPYKIAYALNIALRYLPTVQREFQHIAYGQQVRGLDLTGNRLGIWKKAKGMAAIVVPLVFSSLDRVQTVTDAMELRGFGRSKTRTWYSATQFSRLDYVVCLASLAVLGVSIYLKWTVFSSFWAP
ncbi:energy-coupling factor transporter transmembrane component T family protein [Alicyclobacillus kakegawensis]|uniref:energy-coupling factor transporter transmembrane component T family protein n=1 Tax=Alicyclobacillus kakegawensis TaxID=392012 RepID=UPI00082966C4|nr:energy-coupling factor transporter transmembrane component T [Alicyclobacillus kakegawensis]